MLLTDLRRRWYLLDTDGEAPEPVKRITKADGRITRRAQEVVAPVDDVISDMTSSVLSKVTDLQVRRYREYQE